MAAGFRVRRIKSEQSIGDKLKKARIRKKISVAEVEEATRIRAKFILALESDSWEQIPSEVYGRGYLETYLQYLQVAKDPVMKQYDRERSTYARHCRDSQVELMPKNKLQLPRFLLTPRFFVTSIAGFFLATLVMTIGSQITAFASVPYLELDVPEGAQQVEASQLIVHNNTVKVSGRAGSGAVVEVNGKAVPVQQDGSFSETIQVVKGSTSLLVTASNGKGKTTQEIRSITYN